MVIRTCEACGAPIYRPTPEQILCDLCMRVIDEQTDLLLELEYFDPDNDLFDE
jgi:hypothetical protein